MNTYTKDLIKYLKEYITEERKNLFEDKILERTRSITIVLEDIFQARNISASMRSADCFGVQDVHIIENNNSFADDTEVSLGASKWITVNKFNQQEHNTIEAINTLKSKGHTIIACTPHKSDITLEEINLNNKVALIFGTELKGVSEQALSMADYKMSIPMYGFTESLNISVSVTICLQYLTSQLRKANNKWQLNNAEQNEVMVHWLMNSIKSSKQIVEAFNKKHKTK